MGGRQFFARYTFSVLFIATQVFDMPIIGPRNFEDEKLALYRLSILYK